jgi:hypothetical protein
MPQTFLNWCVGRAVIDASPAEGVPLPGKEVARDRVLTNNELASVIRAARQLGLVVPDKNSKANRIESRARSGRIWKKFV